MNKNVRCSKYACNCWNAREPECVQHSAARPGQRPKDWRTDVLKELRKKLAEAPEGFTEQRLRAAYQHQLADIISLVNYE